ncbi:acyl-CoA N-acyltransferase [Aspergillus pseudonomiae]|uniref:Acyl-CoA N-acyltransferase n=1 Tax=Aspergillus caelatus TaxID=61420 RepID=A0A5N6ZI51_9EURO|nr:acyl-CoA N-acyltransferase [Aspergillus caelatus]KAB8254132.1 acyl-CoA N-acyltransferase [Aspergillus pseudonomiae]KAE8357301.1 acyl-CoA N-acyltransferase [Aspergillus caelatus]
MSLSSLVMEILIEPATFPRDENAIQSLFSRYAASLSIDLKFQKFQKELDSLPGKYAEPQGGVLLLARPIGDRSLTALGCVALRRDLDGWCEMKRLYVAEEARGTKLGSRLVEAIMSKAKELGYRGIRLDSLPEMRAAQNLYRKYGFTEIPPYYNTPIVGTVFMGREL